MQRVFGPRASGPLAALEKSGYTINNLSFPREGLGELGSPNGTKGVPSYIVFYVNLPENSKYETSRSNLGTSVSDQNTQRGLTERSVNPVIGDGVRYAAATGAAAKGGVALFEGATNLASAKASLTSGSGFSNFGKNISSAFSSAKDATVLGVAAAGLTIDVQRKPKFNRISDAIALYMPDTIFHTDAHDYDAASFRDALTGSGLDLLKTQLGANLFKGGTSSPESQEIAGLAIEETGFAGRNYSDFLLRSQGLAKNPMLEMLYVRTGFRNFIYQFKFHPKNSVEADTIREIVKTFRKYAAPDLPKDRGSGFYLIPPANFDIEYRFKGTTNDFISKISSCVLSKVDVNYASAGQFATFVDGAPVEIDVQLSFTEVDVITRDLVEAGF